MKVTVIIGAETDFLRNFQNHVFGSMLVFQKPEDCFLSWSSLLRVMAQVHEFVNWHCIGSPLKSLLFDGFEVATSALGLPLTSHSTHNLILRRPFVEGLAEAFVETLALSGKEFTLVVPNIHNLDRETLGFLRSVYCHHCDKAPHLVIGVDKDKKESPLDANGIIWGIPNHNAISIGFSFSTVPGSSVLLPKPGIEVTKKLPILKPIFREEEKAAFGLLLKDGPYNADERAFLLFIMQKMFARQGFTSCMKLGMSIINRNDKFTSYEFGLLNGIIALAAHNRQFRTDENFLLGQFIESLLAKSLENEKNRQYRHALVYRMAVTKGRRLKKFTQALEVTDPVVNHFRKKLPVQWLDCYHYAWILNFRAFMLISLKDFENSAYECHLAYDILRNANTSGLSKLEKHDHYGSVSLFAENISTLYYRKDTLRSLRWHKVAREWSSRFKYLDMYENHRDVRCWMLLNFLQPAIDKTLSGINCAQNQCELNQLTIHLEQLADLYFRTGSYRLCLEQLDRLRSVECVLGNVVNPFIDLFEATVFFYQKDYSETIDRLQRCLSVFSAKENVANWTELMGWLGLVSALTGDRQKAEAFMNDAISAAVDCGNRSLLCRVSLFAGKALRSLGDFVDGDECISNAYRLMLEDKSSSISSFDSLLVCSELFGGEVELTIDKIISLQFKSLQDRLGWALLPHTISLLVNCELALTANESLITLLFCASQREDCADNLVVLFSGHPGLKAAVDERLLDFKTLRDAVWT